VKTHLKYCSGPGESRDHPSHCPSCVLPNMGPFLPRGGDAAGTADECGRAWSANARPGLAEECGSAVPPLVVKFHQLDLADECFAGPMAVPSKNR
jgi:hypothetical protein